MAAVKSRPGSKRALSRLSQQPGVGKGWRELLSLLVALLVLSRG